MDKHLLCALLLLGTNLFAEPIVVLGKNDVVKPGAGIKLEDPPRAAFLAQARKDREPLATSMNLVNPPEWGRTVGPRTGGEVRFHTAFPGGFVFRLSLHNLLPKHRYILCINGKPGLEGNELLPDPVPGLPAEKYLDFLKVDTDEAGTYQADLAVLLKPGDYRARFYVKDESDSKIVLYHDYFQFGVK